jgi:4-hydroxy-2-oxoglutarate aldolase
MDLSGIYPPICTPFLADGEFSPHKLRTNVEKWIAAGVSGFCATGSTGESKLLMHDEKLKLWQTLRDAAPDHRLIAGTSAESVRETIVLINEAAAIGYGAALVLTPHYFKGQMLRPENQLTFFRAAADGARIPVIIYNFPQNTGIDLPVEAVTELAQHPNIIGIKESSGSVEKVNRLVAETPAGFQVMSGSATTLYASFGAGIVGAILAFANPAPRACIAVYEKWRAGDHAGALTAQRHILHAAALIGSKFQIPGLKYAMDLNGYYGGPVRLPLLPPTAAAKEELDELFRGVS